MNTPALQVSDLHIRLGGAPILRGLGFAVQPGERVAVIGPNGAGKTTLFQVLSGVLRPDAGRVWLAGRDVTAWAPHRLARAGLARSFQIQQLFGPHTVAEHLRCVLLHQHGGWWRRLQSPGMDAAVRDWAERLDLAQRHHTPAQSLSYAEQRRLDVGLALASDAPVLLLDEPTAGLSRSETTELTSRLRAWTTGRTLLMVEHDMDVVFGLADRVLVLVDGQLIADGSPDAVRANPAVQQAYLGAALGAGQ